MDEWSNPIKVPPLPKTITTGGTGKVEYVAVSVTELATLRAENERLAKSLKEYKEAEESVSDAYLRIRALVKSYNTKPGGSDRFEVTEQAIKDLQNENERLKAKLGGPDYLLKLDTYEDTVRELMHELAVRERQAEILDREWDGRHTVESALSQARAEIAKETEAKPGTPITRHEALDISRSILLNTEQARDEQAETEAKQGIQYDELKPEGKP